MTKILDLTGQKYGMLTAISITQERSGTSYKWACSCDCGGSASVASNNLRTGHTMNCGCLTSKMRSENASTHNMSRTSEYKSWVAMKDRCLNTEAQDYKTYGARGITIQPRWVDSFESFFAYMGRKPAKGFSIERIDNDGDYVVGNVRWAPPKDQARNKGMYKSNTTGVSGVNLIEKVPGCWSYIATWYKGGKQTNRVFSIKKHGLLPAFAKAVEFRQKKLAELREEDGYSDKHGDERKSK